ncbi:galactosyltransferase-like protein [Microbacterium sp. SLBN-154]|uniref:glycosyltransferase n=1 Tax=Microbacterium sp. SLBN-154 TaxID=2768458 RepID=UPI001152D269|nr:glycosyltransferase [Microbacterium sp. SLBN-154]TQK20703.1 galactosyltransferase-like protein [Microbacterium sp. SLBN-154]
MTPREPWIVGNSWDCLDGVIPDPLPRVSVIVAHFDQPVELARTLHALDVQDYPADLLEVIVADDGSPGEVAVPAGVTLVRQDDRGFRLSAVRNLGVRASSGDVLCFLDADTAPEPAYVRRLVRLPALLTEAVTVGRRRHADFGGLRRDAPLPEAAAERELAEPSWLRDAYAQTRNLLDADDRSYRFIIGAVMACSRRLYDDVAGFDETFTAYGGEDWEFAHRAWQAGAVFAHVPDAVAWHDGPEWSERDGSDIPRANAQSIRLARDIPVRGSAPRGLLPTAPDLVVHVTGSPPAAALFLTVDSVLAAFPRARVVLDDGVDSPLPDPRVASGALPDARVALRVDRPFVITDPAWLIDLVERLGTGDVGTIRLTDDTGTHLGALRSRRATRRAERWGTESAFRVASVVASGVSAVRDDPRIEAWVGGWGGPDSFR